jgi:adenylate cyclase
MATQNREAGVPALQSWIIEAALAGMPVEELFDGFCSRLVAAGVPVARGFLSIGGLHPLRRAHSLTWEGGRLTDIADFGHSIMATPLWQTSPFKHMMENRIARLHRPLMGNGARLDFPVLREFRDAGMTEWLALMRGFGWASGSPEFDQFGVVLSWTTSAKAGRPQGWSASELAAVEQLSGTLALAAKATNAPFATREVLAAYLGSDAARRVSAGQVRRGDISRIEAAILYADLRGFTSFADEAAPEEVIRRLNGVFDCLGEAVREAGGEILKFLGDGVLAVFLASSSGALSAAAAAAFSAATGAQAKVARLNETETRAGHPALALDMALHAGELTYGNIGTAERLDFTVIGPAVNEATRLEALCKQLGAPILVSESFARSAPALSAKLRSAGLHRLRGVREPQEVFALDED